MFLLNCPYSNIHPFQATTYKMEQSPEDTEDSAPEDETIKEEVQSEEELDELQDEARLHENDPLELSGVSGLNK